MLNDREIWEDFKSGDKKATSKIYHENIQLLYRYGKKFTTDEDLIKDKIQELFYDLIRTRENVGTTDNIRFYLIKALRRRIFSELKKKIFWLKRPVSQRFELRLPANGASRPARRQQRVLPHGEIQGLLVANSFLGI